MIRRVRAADRAEYQRMRRLLWPHVEEDDVDAWLAREDAATFVAERPERGLCGFVEVGARAYADGCDSSPVGFVEGWWVDADMRRAGVGRALLQVAEDWARSRGYTEMASDALLENTPIHEAHRRCGYAEVERRVAFRKPL